MVTYSFETKSLPPRPTAYGLAIVGTLLIAVAVYFAFSTYELQQTGTRTTGTVTSLERTESSFFPVFEFIDSRGRLLEVRSSASSRNYFPGDEIPIVYHPGSPLDARIDDPAGLYVLPMIMSVIGLLFVGGTVLMLKLLPMFEAAYDRDRAMKEADEHR